MLGRGVVGVTIDNPNADGQIAENEHGFGYDWLFRETKHENTFDRNAPLDAQWDYATGGTEYIPVLKACGPRGNVVKRNMVLSQWRQEAGTWAEWTPPGYPQAQYIGWYPSAAGQYGRVTYQSRTAMHFALWLQRNTPRWDETGDCYIGVLIGAGKDQYQYAYYLPLRSTNYKYPRLLRAPAGTPFTMAHTIDERQTSTAELSGLGGGGKEEVFILENTAGHLLMRWSGDNEPWVWWEPGGVYLGPRYLTVFVQGHGLSFCSAGITYPRTSTVTPYNSLTVPSWVNATHEWGWLASGQNDMPQGGAVSVASSTAVDQATDKPVVTFTCAGRERPVCYAVFQTHSPTFTAANSSPYDITTDDASDCYKVLAASWYITDIGRNQRAELTIQANNAASETWRGNQKVTLKAGVQTEADAGNPTLTTQFVGYLKRFERIKDPDEQGVATWRWYVEDGIGARLEGKKFMLWHNAYGGWNSSSAFVQVLQRCGVPDALMDLDLPANTIGDGIGGQTVNSATLPHGDRPGDLLFNFNHEEGAVAALDKMAKSIGCEFGYDAPDGSYFVQEAVRTWDGTIDFTLSDDTTTETDLVRALTVERGNDEFRNHLALFGGQGQAAQGVYMNLRDSAYLPGSALYVGEDWWDVQTEAEVANPVLVAQRRFAEYVKRGIVLTWETHAKPTLFPNHHVLVDVDGMDVPVGSVFRIVDKRGDITMDGDFRCTFTGVLER